MVLVSVLSRKLSFLKNKRRMSFSCLLFQKMANTMVHAFRYRATNPKRSGLVTSSPRRFISLPSDMKLTRLDGPLCHLERVMDLSSCKWKMKTRKSINSTKMASLSKNSARKKSSRSSKAPSITLSSLRTAKKAQKNWCNHWMGSQKLQDSQYLNVSNQINLSSLGKTWLNLLLNIRSPFHLTTWDSSTKS